MTINNQTAVLKVVENLVYFSVQAQISAATATSGALKAFTTTQNVVPVGFVMNVTPQISEDDMVVLNVRPTVSAMTGTVRDPNPDLAAAGVVSEVPVIQSREFESVLRVPSGSISVLGGLMQDRIKFSRDGLPILSRIPVLGDLVSYRNDVAEKSELVIFLRPIIVRDFETDLLAYRAQLPESTFFREADPVSAELEDRLRRLERRARAPDEKR
jgi:MSHA biogenesis protein MshL